MLVIAGALMISGRLPAPVLDSLRWPSRPDLPGGNPAWSYLIQHPHGDFSLFVISVLSARFVGGFAQARSLTAAGFADIQIQDVDLRLEKGEPVKGFLVEATKAA